MKTTKKHFQYFRKRCEHYASILGLHGWRLDYSHETIKQTWLAWVNMDTLSRRATICFHTVWEDEPITNNNIDQMACHEVLEIFLERACDRFTHSDEAESNRHAVIATLQRILTSTYEGVCVAQEIVKVMGFRGKRKLR